MLVSLLIRTCHQTEINDLSPKSVSAMSSADKLDHVRQLGRSLFSGWNFGGESKIEGNKNV